MAFCPLFYVIKKNFQIDTKDNGLGGVKSVGPYKIVR